MREPIGSQWKMVSQSFWTLGNNWARRERPCPSLDTKNNAT